ncbi:ccr4 associated factor [Tieghemiomyces parasiticus]|uniref:Ccr4 associated factor n=1 Tax=Tieghemiomyces parasiticus TaxID=78921 RepID=A0A9W8AMM4_9FUNG|nr:ccr4 associated factor [Tieghemiomyces parasiticus]
MLVRHGALRSGPPALANLRPPVQRCLTAAAYHSGSFQDSTTTPKYHVTHRLHTPGRAISIRFLSTPSTTAADRPTAPSSSVDTTSTDPTYPAALRGLPVYPDPTHVLDQTDHYCRVPGRGLIQVAGEDATAFLQGLITNHMPKLAVGGGGFYAHFLVPQGRVLYDALVYPRNVGERFPMTPPAFLIECDVAVATELCKQLSLRRLRAKVQVEMVTEQYTVWNIWGPGTNTLWCWSQQLTNPRPTVAEGGTISGPEAPVNQTAAQLPRGSLVLKSREIGIWMHDTRAPGLGLRVVLPATDPRPGLPASFREVNPLTYTLRRLLLGVPEGSREIAPRQVLPLEYNLDYMHGVDFRKGCYVGQELTIRTYHTGVIRKRVVPVALVPDAHTLDPTRPVSLELQAGFELPDHQADIYRVSIDTTPAASLAILAPTDDVVPEDTLAEPTIKRRTRSPRPSAKFCGGVGNIGLALVRLETLHDPEHKFVALGRSPDGVPVVLRVLPRTPDWWPQTP